MIRSMSRTMLRRVERLEAAQPQRTGKWHLIMVHEGEDPEPKRAALRASGEAQEGDHFIVVQFVRPKHIGE
jgi:hypothetical protein